MGAHAVLVSGPGLGHVNGCTILAKALLSAASSFSHITIVCFARSFSTHSSAGRLPSLSHPSVRFEILDDGLPSDTSCYSDLFTTTPTMHRTLIHLLQSLTQDERLPAPVCLISDTIMAWTQTVANHVGIPRVEYWTASATAYLCILSLPQLKIRGLACCHQGPQPKGWRTETKVLLDCIAGLPNFPLEEVPREFRYVESEDNPVVQKFSIAAQHAKDAACLLVHTMCDLEREAVEGLEQVGIKAYAIGPLVHLHEEEATSGGDQDNRILTWLDSHAPSSVIYVSFGSNAKLTTEELVELAFGLEASGQPFLWVVRSDATVEGADLNDVLPSDFFTRISEQGLIVPWAPQRSLLAHPAVGGFLSHCGWNSTLESLWTGVPILACPRTAEQPTNCRLIVKEWAVGIELQTNLDGTFTRQDVAAGVRTLLTGTSGDIARTNARKLSKKMRISPFEGGNSHSSLLEFASKFQNDQVK